MPLSKLRIANYLGNRELAFFINSNQLETDPHLRINDIAMPSTSDVF